MRWGPSTGCRSGDLPRCEAEPVPGENFCADHLAVLHRVRDEMSWGGPAGGGTIRGLRPKPEHLPPPTCAREGCERPAGHGPSGAYCYRDRGGLSRRTCTWPGCERAPNNRTGTRCSAHPMYRYPDAVAA